MRIYASALRIKEIFLMTGFSVIGILFTNAPTLPDVKKLTVVFTVIMLYVMAVYFLNSFADYKNDALSDRLKKNSKVPRWGYVSLLLLATVLFVSGSLLINNYVVLCNVTALLLWSLYYLPPARLKSTLFAGTAIHFAAGVLHFHSGYCSFSPYSTRSILIAAFFALLLAVGHLHHEIIDYDDDLFTGNKTTAVRVGLHKAYVYRERLAIVTALYWLGIFIGGYTNKIEFAIFLLPVVALLIICHTFKSPEKNKLFQVVNRSVFGVSGLFLIVYKLLAYQH